MSSVLGAPADGEGRQRLHDEDVEGDGHVMDLMRVWAHAPELQDGVGSVLGRSAEVARAPEPVRAAVTLGRGSA